MLSLHHGAVGVALMHESSLSYLGEHIMGITCTTRGRGYVGGQVTRRRKGEIFFEGGGGGA